MTKREVMRERHQRRRMWAFLKFAQARLPQELSEFLLKVIESHGEFTLLEKLRKERGGWAIVKLDLEAILKIFRDWLQSLPANWNLCHTRIPPEGPWLYLGDVFGILEVWLAVANEETCRSM